MKPSAPPVGNQSSRTAKKKISIRPSQKLGVACPITASVRATQSSGEARLSAATMPSGIPRASAKTSPATPSLKVLNARSPIASIVLPPRNEWPKSSRAISQTKFTYCFGIESFSPKRSLIASICSLVDVVGSTRNVSGLPTTRATTKTIVTTMKTTRSAWMNRMTRKFQNCIAHPRDPAPGGPLSGAQHGY